MHSTLFDVLVYLLLPFYLFNEQKYVLCDGLSTTRCLVSWVDNQEVYLIESCNCWLNSKIHIFIARSQQIARDPECFKRRNVYHAQMYHAHICIMHTSQDISKLWTARNAVSFVQKMVSSRIHNRV